MFAAKLLVIVKGLAVAVSYVYTGRREPFTVHGLRLRVDITVPKQKLY